MFMFSMSTKTITITEEAYEFFKKLKHKDESFSQLFLRLAKKKGVAQRYFGSLHLDSVALTQKHLLSLRKDINEDFRRRKRVFP